MVTPTGVESIADSRRLAAAAYNFVMNVSARSITPARVHSDFAALNAIGRDPATAMLARPAGSAAETAALAWLRRRSEAAHLVCRLHEHGFTVRFADDTVTAVVIAGELAAADGAGPFDGAFGIVAGLEVLRVLPRAVTGVVLGGGTALTGDARCVFHCAVAGGSMLADSGRQFGVALSDTAPLSLRRVAEIGEMIGVPVLPMPFAATGVVPSDAPSCVLVVDPGLNRWPPAEPAWAALTAGANLLLNLVDDVAAN